MWNTPDTLPSEPTLGSGEPDMIFITIYGDVHKGWYSDYWKDGVFYTQELGGEHNPKGYPVHEVKMWTKMPRFKLTHP